MFALKHPFEKLLAHPASYHGWPGVATDSAPRLTPSARSPVVAASVLCSAVHLMASNADIIKRWVNEVQEAAQVTGGIVGSSFESAAGGWRRGLPGLRCQGCGWVVRPWGMRCSMQTPPQHTHLQHTPSPPLLSQSKHPMVQFHAVALLHALRATDRLAVSKLVSQLTKAAVKSPMAQCLLVRYVAQVGAVPSKPFQPHWGSFAPGTPGIRH